jgi:hypothetical protein
MSSCNANDCFRTTSFIASSCTLAATWGRQGNAIVNNSKSYSGAASFLLKGSIIFVEVLHHCWSCSPSLLETFTKHAGDFLHHCWRFSPKLPENFGRCILLKIKALAESKI